MASGKKTAPGAPVKWTPQKQLAFLEHLQLSSNVAASERVADVPAGAAYRYRNKSATFRASWELALKIGYDRLEMAMLERAINGAVVRRTTKGDECTEVIEYNDRVAVTLINSHREHVAAITRAQGAETARETLQRKLAAMSRRLGGEG